MSDGNLPIESGQCGSHGSGGVTMNQYHVGSKVGQHTAHTQQNFRGDVVQVLIRSHDVEVIIGMDVEYLKHLVQHLAMLGRDTDARVKVLRVLQKRLDQRSHLDGFGAGTENEKYLFHNG